MRRATSTRTALRWRRESLRCGRASASAPKWRRCRGAPLLPGLAALSSRWRRAASACRPGTHATCFNFLGSRDLRLGPRQFQPPLLRQSDAGRPGEGRGHFDDSERERLLIARQSGRPQDAARITSGRIGTMLGHKSRSRYCHGPIRLRLPPSRAVGGFCGHLRGYRGKVGKRPLLPPPMREAPW
jgi:hypothetical protein